MQPAWKNRNSNKQYYLHIKREAEWYNCLIFIENKIKSGGLWCKFLDIIKKYQIQAKIGAILFQNIHNNFAIFVIKWP